MPPSSTTVRTRQVKPMCGDTRALGTHLREHLATLLLSSMVCLVTDATKTLLFM